MLRHAASNTGPYQDRLTLLWQNASHLPFPDNAFDAVTCLEALEFLPDAQATLSEIVRVLRPGGVLLTSNRVGPHARWMPGRTMSRQAFTELLESLSLSDVRVGSWQIDYDIAWARKPGQSHVAAPATLPALLRCPRCFNGPLGRQDQALRCSACNHLYPIADDGVVEMGW
jgi:SAM-dependent methyltransferase